jgi:D-alanyl-D-alanine carboxypeptidase/D-alanyl-D-alanine-endopeptidase (penicillin-binding protein 4)
VLTLLLRAHGVEVVGASRSGEAPGDAAEVASLPSIPVSEIVAEMLRDSDNETAEAALKEVGHAEAGEGSWSAGARAATDLLAGAEVPLDGVSIVDGSGLSIENRLTCTALVDVLTRPETGPVVRDGLAVAGETGTLAERWNGTAAEGRLRAKTGTLRNVTALAGEIDVRDGDTVTFAYVANVPDPNEVTPEQVGLTGLADVLMAYPRGVDVAQLEPAAATPAATPAAG